MELGVLLAGHCFPRGYCHTLDLWEIVNIFSFSSQDYKEFNTVCSFSGYNIKDESFNPWEVDFIVLNVWLSNVGLQDSTNICDESGEDASCSRSVMGNNIVDHPVYSGVNLQAEAWNSCKVVTDPRLAKYSN